MVLLLGMGHRRVGTGMCTGTAIAVPALSVQQDQQRGASLPVVFGLCFFRPNAKTRSTSAVIIYCTGTVKRREMTSTRNDIDVISRRLASKLIRSIWSLQRAVAFRTEASSWSLRENTCASVETGVIDQQKADPG
jgi:hypothetical protein